jgi:hypothetical protein
MDQLKKYENFPWWIVVISNAVSLSIYVLGFTIMLRLSWIISILYLIGLLIFEIRLIRNHCVDCYYWGKTCGFGKGRLSSLFFKKGDTSRFCSGKMSWKDVVPDMLISFVPTITGIVLLILKFDLLILISLILILLLSTMGNGFIRGNLTCKFCKQKDIGCPADKLFNKNK